MARNEKGRPAGGDPIPNAVCQDEPESISQPDQLQAPPDNRGEDDWTFFRRRPDVCTRTRLPFENEFPPGVLDAERIAFVHVVTLRDPVTNEPTTRGRGVFYADSSDGGRA